MAETSVNWSESLLRMVMPLAFIGSFLLQHIAHADDRMDQRESEFFIDLRPEVVDINVDQVGSAVIVDPPDGLRNKGPGKHAVLVDDQQLEQRELLCGQDDLPARPPG